ncbi:cytochrome c oxidase 10 [Wolffia australiana]
MWRGAAAGVCSQIASSSRGGLFTSSGAISSSLLAPKFLSSIAGNDALRKRSLFSAPFSSTAVESPIAPLPHLRNPLVGFVLSENLAKIGGTARHFGRCYWELSKAKLSLLVVATSGAGFVLGSGTVIDLTGLCCTCAGTMAVAAAANSLNQVFEVKNDAKMKRTRNRPLPSGRLSVPHAVAWASMVGLSGTALLAAKTNDLSAGLAASNLALYAFIYTPLKQIHPVNTWVGAVVGAIPPLLGWAAAAGEISANSFILPAALYFWQIPHFMALAYFCRSDYAAGGFKMFSLNDASGWRTSLVSLRNALYLLPVGYLAYHWGLTGGWFAVESTILTAGMTLAAASFAVERTPAKARRMFHASLLYLPIFMSVLLVHRLPHRATVNAAEDEYRIEGWNINSSQIEETKPRQRAHKDDRPMPPVAYASAAPFPFLPAPVYAS